MLSTPTTGGIIARAQTETFPKSTPGHVVFSRPRTRTPLQHRTHNRVPPTTAEEVRPSGTTATESEEREHARSESVESSGSSSDGVVPQDYDDFETGINRDAFSPTDLAEDEEIGEGTKVSTTDMDIIDVEVTNTETETTVNLIHLLGMRGGSSPAGAWDPMESIEESESESEEDNGAETVVHNFTGRIPALVVLDENNCLVETLHEGRQPLGVTDGLLGGAAEQHK